MLRTESICLLLAVTLACAAAPAGAEDRTDANRSITVPGLVRIMADPDWIGPPVEAAWWQLDGESLIYRVKRAGSDQHDLHRVWLADGRDERLDYADHAAIDGENPVLDRERGRAVFAREGNLFLRTLETGQLRQLTRGREDDRRAAFSADGGAVHFLRGGDWWTLDLESGRAGPVADLRLEDPPHADPEDDLEAMQLRLFSTLAEEHERGRAAREEAERAAREDASRAPAPWYLGEDKAIVDTSLSPDGRHLLISVRDADGNDGRPDKMPNYVTRSGYVEVEDVRTLVGRELPSPQQLWLLDLEQREKHELALDGLEGLDEDPLAELKRAQDVEPHDADDPRGVQITGMEWSHNGLAAVQIRAIDNKDRWLATLDPQAAELIERHRLNDPAWINSRFNEFGWLPESTTLWLLSEETGFSHFYTIDLDARRVRARQHTGGRFEVSEPEIGPDGRHVLLLSNRSHPTQYDVYRLDLETGDLERLTELRGLESFVSHPLDGRALLRHSSAYVPVQVAVLDPDDTEVRTLTDTRTDEYREIVWQPHELVAVESTHGAGDPIWSKFYPARSEHPSGSRPAVLFVHGAGYLQNTHERFPQYFREQMFHNLLTDRGYHVLDMDYRASSGYGRDWRTAIYRQMGTPELEDLLDGVAWLVENHDVDPERIGVYGGSYGGFMAFMALFNAPEVFAAGAALRPVTDWAHYSQPYTSNILNTPQVDPGAYERSSPIEFAEGLAGHLLITHGMLDDNVFYQDSVRLAQRLIELEKENWELASYPLEPHAFEHPKSWLDQYRRVLRLFETTIGAD